jgi:hypothetical protein
VSDEPDHARFRRSVGLGDVSVLIVTPVGERRGRQPAGEVAVALGVGSGVGTTDVEPVPVGVPVGVDWSELPPDVVGTAVVVGWFWLVSGAGVVVAGRSVAGAVVPAGTEVPVPAVADPVGSGRMFR